VLAWLTRRRSNIHYIPLSFGLLIRSTHSVYLDFEEFEELEIMFHPSTWGSVYLSLLEFSSILPRHPRHIPQTLSILCSLALPDHWDLYLRDFRFLDVFQVFHGWLPILEDPPHQKVFSMFGPN
jgi:hypothetical protein